jgi:hypothetical protein
MKKNEVTPEVEAQIVNLNKRLGRNHGASVMQELGNRTKSDPQAAQYAVGDELYIDDNVNNLFMQTFNGRNTAGVTAACKTAAGTTVAKALYFGALDRSVPEYGANLQPTGLVEPAKTDEYHDVYDVVSNCATEAEVWEAIKGKSLRVAKIKQVTGARFNAAGQVTGTRTRNIPVFTFVE